MRRKNLNASEGIEREKVGVTTDDVGRMAAHSELEELVVLSITASCYLYVHIYPLSLSHQSGEKASNIILTHIGAELFSAQNFVEFGEPGKGKQDFPFLECQIKSLARLGTRQEQRTDEDVRIEDAAQLCALQ
jgi:hypothetical protein